MDGNIDKSFSPTVEWMAQKYEEMNKRLFNGRLGSCDFGIFTSGKGSEGRTLGRFRLCNRAVKGERSTRRMFIVNTYYGERTYIDRGNFEDYCWPKIELNGNYTGTEHAFLGTLVHEMCHYYTYMNGYIPKQGHGTEFRNIAQYVSINSNGEFTIQRLATAEEMSEFELSDEMKEKRTKKIANKKSAITVLFRFKINKEIEMTTTSNESLISNIINTYNKDDVLKVCLSKDQNLIDLIFEKGYRKNFRTWRYWNVERHDWANNLDVYNMTTYSNPKYERSNLESVRNTKSLIEGIIEEFLKNKMSGDDDVIDISPDMNLGLHSPFEEE